MAPDGSLRTRQVRPAVVDDPVGGQPVWFNQIVLLHYANFGGVDREMLRLWGEDALPTNAYFGDGTPIDPEDVLAIKQQSMQQAIVFSWQGGDC